MQSSEDYKKYYEEEAKATPLWGGQREVALAENIIAHLPKPLNSVLDVGCGDGFFLDQVIKTSPNTSIFGVDISNERLKRSKENVPKGSFQNAEIEALPFDSNFFDAVVCSEVVEHLERPEKAIEELWRVTKKTLIITVPNDQLITQVTCPECSKKFTLDGHLHQINESKLAGWIGLLSNKKASYHTFHTIFSYNNKTLKWPGLVRKTLDKVLVKSTPIVRFTKPNFLMAVVQKTS